MALISDHLQKGKREFYKDFKQFSYWNSKAKVLFVNKSYAFHSATSNNICNYRLCAEFQQVEVTDWKKKSEYK